MNHKRVLLISPRFPERLGRLNIPMGLMSVGSSLIQNGYKVRILSLQDTKEEFLNIVRQELSEATAVGLSVMNPQIPNALEVSKMIRQCNSSIPIIWGGVYPTLYPEQVAKCSYVDYAVRGEGESTIVELLEAIEQGKNLEDIHGIAFQSNGHQVITPHREFLDINKLPHMEWELLKDLKPNSTLKEIEQLGDYVWLETSRGCPHLCTFCINPILKLRYRCRESSLVLDDIEELINLGLGQISFVDDAFFARGKRKLEEFVEGIFARGLKFKWYGTVRADYFRANYIDEELAARLKRSGCTLVGIGAESGSQRVLDMLQKDITIADTLNAARTLKKAGIHANFSFMIGLPDEAREDIKKTLELIKQLAGMSTTFRITGPQVYRPYPGSSLFTKCLAYGMKEPATVEEWAHSPYIQEGGGSAIDTHPWIKSYPLEEIRNIAFYSRLIGVRSRWQLLTRFVRWVALQRCNAFYFRFPFEKKVWDFALKHRFLKPPILGEVKK